MNTNQSEKLAARLKKLRREKNKTQEELASELGVTRSCLANYENGKRMPDGEMLKNLASALEVSIDSLMSYSNPRSVPFREEELKNYIKADKQLREYGNALNLNEVNHMSRLHLIQFFLYLKEKDAEEGVVGDGRQ